MANTKSALKEIRKNARRRVRNRLVRTRTRTVLKRAVRSAQDGEQTAAEDARVAFSALDKAAQKGVIHKNAAARRKARLAKRLRAKTPTSSK